jgi:hypothetical protein
MAKRKSELLVRGVLLRDVAALKRRVQALEKALWPSETSRTPTRPGRRRAAVVDKEAARRAAIEAFDRANRLERLRKHPRLLARERAERARLNAYLRARGFEPEPDLEG